MILNSGTSLFSTGGQESITTDELGNLRCIMLKVSIDSSGNVSTPLNESDLVSIAKVEGQGVIYCLFVRVSGRASYPNLFGTKIDIDSETIIKKNVMTDSSNSHNVSGIVFKDIFNILTNSNTYMSNVTGFFLNREDWPISYEQKSIEDESAEERRKYENIFLIDKPLIFNNGFEIFADHETNIVQSYDTQCFCLYKINE